MMKSSQRLALLKEIAGARIYEERKADAQKILDEDGWIIYLLLL